MKNVGKRFWSLLLALMMVFTIEPIQYVSAEEDVDMADSYAEEVQPSEPVEVEIEEESQPGEPVEGEDEEEVQPSEAIEGEDEEETQPSEPVEGETEEESQPGEPVEGETEEESQPSEPIEGEDEEEPQPGEAIEGEVEEEVQPSEPVEGEYEEEPQPSEPVEGETEEELQPDESVEGEYEEESQPSEPVDGTGDGYSLDTPFTPEEEERYTIDEYNGGYALSLSYQTVYNSATSYAEIGHIYKNEGITVLRTGDNWAHIEYSTSNGAKQGYIYNPNYWYPDYNTCVGMPITTTAVYYGPNASTYQQVGTVFYEEYVVVLGYSNDWAYIEYNTTSGRKRGFVPDDNLDMFYWGRLEPHILDQAGSGDYSYISGRKYVYAGPTTMYHNVGYVENEYIIEHNILYVDADDAYFQFIEYYTSSGLRKSGFIPW